MCPRSFRRSAFWHSSRLSSARTAEVRLRWENNPFRHHIITARMRFASARAPETMIGEAPILLENP